MTKGKIVISALKEIFERHGIPEKVRSDNGPLFDRREFIHLAREWGIQLRSSGPYYAQSNGEADRSVQTIKNMKSLLVLQNFTIARKSGNILLAY